MKRSSRFSWRGLTPQLFVIVILPLIALLLIITYGGLALHGQSMRTLVGERDQRATRAAAGMLNEQFNHRRKSIHSLALRFTSDLSQEDLNAILKDAEHLLPDFDAGLAWISPTGNVIAYSGDSTLWENIEPSTISYMEKLSAKDNNTNYFTAHHPMTSAPLVYIVSSLNDSSMTVGAFTPSSMIHSTLVDVFDPEEGTSVFVLDSEHQLLYSLGDVIEHENLASHPGVKEALAGEDGATYLQIGDTEHVVTYSPVPPLAWALVIEEPWETVASPLLRVTEDAPLALVPVVVMALVALWFVTRRVVQPLQALESKAAEMAWGDYAAIEEPVGGIAEVRRLQFELIHLAHKVKSAQQGLRDYIGAMTLGQEEERRRLALELHDDTLQALIALNQRVQLAHMSLNGSPQASSLADIQGLTDQTIQNLRRVTHGLRPVYLDDLGLIAALEMLARETQGTSGINFEFERTGTECRLDPIVELALYRMAQEALSNIVRHAKATQANLQIAFTAKSVELQVSDNGIGFNVPESPAEFAPSGHFGMLGLHERAEMIGAQLKIKSKIGQGTQLLITLNQPVEELTT